MGRPIAACPCTYCCGDWLIAYGGGGCRAGRGRRGGISGLRVVSLRAKGRVRSLGWGRHLDVLLLRLLLRLRVLLRLVVLLWLHLRLTILHLRLSGLLRRRSVLLLLLLLRLSSLLRR